MKVYKSFAISASERSSLQWDPQADIGAPLAVGRQRIRVKVYSFLHSFIDLHDYALEFEIFHKCFKMIEKILYVYNEKLTFENDFFSLFWHKVSFKGRNGHNKWFNL